MFDAIPKQIQTSPDEMKAFSGFVGTLLGNVRARHRPSQPFMYHYTNAVGFCGIVDSMAVHATHIAYMNDADEYKHAVDLLLLVLADAEQRKLSPAQSRIVGLMKENLMGTRPSNYYPVFVSCFSALDDDLSQWRSYGGQNAGFGIGFDINHMIYLTDQWRQSGSLMGYVTAAIYDEAEKLDIVKQVAEFAVNRYPTDEACKQSGDLKEYAQRWLADFFSLVSLLAPLLKHDKFNSEQEWRLVFTPFNATLVEFKPKQGLICPYVKVDLKSNSYENFNHPFRRVVIGPTRYTELNHQAVWSMLSIRGCEGITLDVSKVPYRDVS